MGTQLVPVDAFPRDYYTTDDWTTQSIAFVKQLRASAPSKPFLLYLAHNAVHAPLQAKPADLAKYRGRYAAGWTAMREARLRRQVEMGLVPPDTVLPPSDPRVPDWDTVPAEDRALFERHMEAYAAMLDSVDQNLGRLVAFLEQLGELDNTIILFSSDNGGTDAGGPTGMFNNNRRYMGLASPPIEQERALAEDLGGRRSASLYPTGWGQVSNTPFPSFKTYTGAGGRRVSFVVSWPARIPERGAIRTQFAHVTDVMPTLLELAGVAPLDEIHGRRARPMQGASFARVLLDPDAPPARTEQYYECWSNRAYYRDGWLARSLQKRGEPIDLGNWTLHHLDRDFSESTDVASQHPQRLRELVEAFDRAAWQYLVYPIDNRDRREKFADRAPDEGLLDDTPRTFLSGMQTVHRADVFPLIANRSFRIRARFAHRDGDAGVPWAIGDPTGGIVVWVEDGALHAHYNGFGERTTLPGVPLAPGEHVATLDYVATGGREGQGRLLLDDAPRTAFERMAPTMVLYGVFEGLDVGLDRRGPVLCSLYERHGAFPYAGRVHDVTIEPGARAPNGPRAPAATTAAPADAPGPPGPGHAGRPATRRQSMDRIPPTPPAEADDRRDGARGQAASAPASCGRRGVLGAGLVWAAAGALPARARDAYPSRPIRVIVPVVAGGALDNVARMLAQRMSERLGQQLLVENRPGAAGVIGMDAVAKAAPDGYTLLFAAAPIALNTALGMKLPYDPYKDFAAISLIASIPGLFAVHPSTPYRTLADVVEDSRRRPEGVSYAVANVGAVTHLMGEAWKAKTGANLTMVAYKGAGQAIQDAVAGTVPVILDTYIPTGVQVAAGKLRAIAVASTQRSAVLPDVPTVVEQGMPELVGSGFYGLLAPAGTPAAIVARLHAAAIESVDRTDMRERLVKQGYDVHASTPQGYTDFIRNEIERWTPIVKSAGIKV